MGRTACTEPHCLYKGALYLYYEPSFTCQVRVVYILLLWKLSCPLRIIELMTEINVFIFTTSQESQASLPQIYGLII